MAVKQETIDKYLGKVFKTNTCDDVEVIEVLECSHCLIKFLDTGNLMEVANVCLINGKIKDNGVTYRRATAPTSTKEYRAWFGMTQRATNRKVQARYTTYKSCTISEDFKSFDYFKDWYNSQIGCDQDGWHLDKDLLFKGNKVYSAETCVLLPQQINNLITGANAIRGDLPKGVYYDKSKGINSRYRARVSQDGKYVCYGSYSNLDDAWLAYKEAKEAWVKVVAERWKDKIDPRAYNALLNYTVEWDD